MASQPVTVNLHPGDVAIVLFDGEVDYVYWESFTGSNQNGHSFPPLVQAAWVARLRALANIIEGAT